MTNTRVYLKRYVSQHPQTRAGIIAEMVRGLVNNNSSLDKEQLAALCVMFEGYGAFNINPVRVVDGKEMLQVHLFEVAMPIATWLNSCHN